MGLHARNLAVQVGAKGKSDIVAEKLKQSGKVRADIFENIVKHKKIMTILSDNSIIDLVNVEKSSLNLSMKLT